MRKKDFKGDFLMLLNKLREKDPFAFIRFSDGEQYILDNPPEIKTGLFNEGGLASINNPEYNMLMKASNFDV